LQEQEFIGGDMRGRNFPIIAGIIAAVASLPSVAASADEYPNRLVRVIVPQAAGGATDIYARKISQALSERWKQPVVVENRVGAGGTLGTDAVAKAAPDGYTLLVTYAGSQAINPGLYANLPFDSVKDFQPIATLAVTPFFFVASTTLPVKTFADFLALARKKERPLNYGSAGVGSVNHLLGEMLNYEAKTQLQHVPYRGASQALADVIGHQIDSAFTSIPSSLSSIRSGQIQGLAVSSAKRIAVAPDIPSIAEAGFPGFDVNPWWGILGPKGMDAAIVTKINADVAEAMKGKELQDFFAAQGAEIVTASPYEFGQMLKADIEKWSKVIKAAGLKPIE
jgi:tripartite-type tricarboxylate transporter receptor subunit TctC